MVVLVVVVVPVVAEVVVLLTVRLTEDRRQLTVVVADTVVHRDTHRVEEGTSDSV